MTEPSSPPAGFYDVGGGRQRWFDGTTWTDHYQPAPVDPRLVVAVKPERTAINWSSNLGLVAALLAAFALIAGYGTPALVLALLAVGLGVLGIRWGSRFRNGHISPGIVGIVIGGGILLIAVIGFVLVAT
jgi:hypothetical protein